MSIIGALPNTLANGTIADATQVMADFNQIVNNVNTNAAALSDLAATTGSSLVGFVQSGTSMQATDLQTKVRLVLNPLDGGCAGDLTTDDATNFATVITRASAIAALYGSVVEIDGAGLGYLIGTTLTLPSLVVIKNCLLKAKDSLNAAVIQTTNFATLTGTTTWLTSAGVPYGFGLLDH